MTPAHFLYDTAHDEEQGRTKDVSDRLCPTGLGADVSCVSKARRAPATIGMSLGLFAIVLAGCAPFGREEDDVPEVAPFDTVLISDFLRFKLDGDMEVDRADTDCYGGLCVTTDGQRILFTKPEHTSFAGFGDFKAKEDTIQSRYRIKFGDVSVGEKRLPDIAGVASDRTITGWGGWGEYVGFDTLYYDFVRDDRPQRMVWAMVGGFRSEGNPVGDSMTWKGGATTIDFSEITENRNLLGYSELRLRFSEPLDETLVTLAITNLRDVETGKGYDRIAWGNIPLRDGGFHTFFTKG